MLESDLRVAFFISEIRSFKTGAANIVRLHAI